MDERVDPQTCTDEVTTLVEFLDWYRATVFLKIYGLTDDQARTRSTPPSTLSLVGIVRHIARSITAAANLDDHGQRMLEGRPVNLRWILVHMIEEYARHAGHMDLLRQAVDGQTGD